LNNVVEADHGKLIRPSVAIKDFEVMRALRKCEAGAFNITRNINGEARVVERAFGLGTSVLAEAVQFVSERREPKAA
jgi:hypothetical protein